MDFSKIITENIDDRFCYIQYDDLNLIMMKENNFINATKLCKLGGKDFFHWKENKRSLEFVEFLKDELVKSDLIPGTRNSGGLDIMKTVQSEGKNNTKYEVSGTYVHQDLIPHIASWVSNEFSYKVSKIINAYFSNHYEFKLKEQKTEIDYLKNINSKLDKMNKNNRCHKQVIQRDLLHIKQELIQVKSLFKDRIIKPVNTNKHNCFLVLQNIYDRNKFKVFRVQQERVDKLKTDNYKMYETFYESYDPNAIAYYNKLKESFREVFLTNYSNLELIDLDPESFRNELNKLDRSRFLSM